MSASDHEPDFHSGPYGPRPVRGRRAARRDTSSVWLGNLIFLVGAVFGMGLMFLLGRMFPASDSPEVEHFKEVHRLLLETHVAELDSGDLVEDAIKGMFEGLEEELGDTYSRYYRAEETFSVERDTTGSFLGIGVVFRGGISPPQILFPVEGGPAERGGLRVGDTLLSIDGQDLTPLEPQAVYDLLRGEAGEVLEIEVEGLDGERRRHAVVLQSLIDPSVRHVDLVDEERGIGYLAILGFSTQTVRQFDTAVRALQARGMRALVIDLRGNRGGVLTAAITIARRFIHSGRITSTEGRGEPEIEHALPAQAIYLGMPLVLLVDTYSASASEVLAGALQDHRAAVLVGEPTYGKGMVQTIDRYPEHEAIAKVTNSFYYTPAHRNLEAHYGHGAEIGLTPDVLVEIDSESRARIEGFLHGTFFPPPGALAVLRAWERESGEELLGRRPPDAALEAALTLFRGEHPTAAELASKGAEDE